MKPQRAAIYCRISEKDERYDKVDVQERQLRKLAKDNDYVVVDVFRDDGISAYSIDGNAKRRHEWEQLLISIRDGKFDVVLAVAPDRFTRDTGTGHAFNVLCTQAGVTLHTKSAGKVDPSDPMSRAMASVMTVFAEMDVAVRRNKLRDRFEEETRQGNPLWGVRPFGYSSDRRELHPTESIELRNAYDSVLAGRSLYSVMKDWNDRGVLTTRGNHWSYGSFQQMLKRRRNAGLVERHGEVVEGVKASWPAIVTRAELDATVAILTNPSRRTLPGRKPKWLAPGLIRCGVCGSVMRSGTSTPPRAASHPVYRCATKMGIPTNAGRHVTYKIEIADARIREALVSALFFMPADQLPSAGATTEDPRLLEAELTEIQRQKAVLVDMAIRPNWVGDVALKQSELDAAEQSVRLRLEASAQAAATSTMDTALRRALWARGTVSIDDAVAVRSQIAEQFDGLDLSTKRELVRWLLDIEVMPGRTDERLKIRHKVVTSLNEPDVA